MHILKFVSSYKNKNTFLVPLIVTTGLPYPDEICPANLCTLPYPDGICPANLCTLPYPDEICPANLCTLPYPDEIAPYRIPSCGVSAVRRVPGVRSLAIQHPQLTILSTTTRHS